MPLAFAILMTLPGIPAIYYGDEVGLTSAWARDGDDDGLLRPPLALGDLTGAGELLASVQALGRFRRSNPWLCSAGLTEVTARAGVLTYTVRGSDRAIRVDLNPTDEKVELPAGGPVLAGASAGGTELAPWSWQIRGD